MGGPALDSWLFFSAERVDWTDILRPGGYGLRAGLFVLQGLGKKKHRRLPGMQRWVT